MDFFDYQPESEAQDILTVSQVNRNIKLLIEQSLPWYRVEGELSNFKHHSSGHMYFSLKDEASQLPCVMWAGRNSSLRFRPENGMKVQCYGRITVYERRGVYQLDVMQMSPAGLGDLQLAFERLKEKLAAEGLFDAGRKRPLPLFPARIGVVTSPTGAAIRDLISVLRRRWPVAEIILRPALVQGPDAAADIVAGIEEFNEFGEVDVLIVGRGGGSLEDLWPFNEEIVARAIVQSSVPVVSAVGHEVDFTIADFVADLRAPTPSAAAELVVPDHEEVRATMVNFILRGYRSLMARIRELRHKTKALHNSYALQQPRDLIRQYRQTCDELRRRLENSMLQRITRDRVEVESLRKRLIALGHDNVLKRGYTMALDAQSGHIITSVSALSTGQKISVRFHDGRAGASVNEIEVDES